MAAEKGKIVRLISAQQKVGNTLYKYEVEAPSFATSKYHKTGIVFSIQKYELGEPVQVIWSDLSTQYNTPYLKKIVDK